MSGIFCKDGIIVRQGDSFALKLHFQDEQGDVDLTGAKLRMSVADKSGNKVIQKEGDISDASRGFASIDILPSDTNIAVGDYLTDIQIELANGQIHTIYPQNVNTLAYFRISPQVTE